MGNNEDDGCSSRPILIVTADASSGVGLTEGNISPLTQPRVDHQYQLVLLMSAALYGRHVVFKVEHQ